MWFWVNLISLNTFSIAISIKQKKQKLNEAITVSNKEVFDYRYRDSTNGKSIINFMINKDKQGKAQTGKHQYHWYLRVKNSSVTLMLTSPSQSPLLYETHHLTRNSLYNQCAENVKDRADRPLTFSELPWWNLVWWQNRNILVSWYITIFIAFFAQVII